MGHIKEPKGVDFIIESKPLTEEETNEISEFIRKDKAKLEDRRNPSRTNKTPKEEETTG